MNCESCKEKKKQAEPVPFQTHQSDMARMERTNLRLWILLIVMLVLLVGTNGAWIWRESQFADEVVTQEVETGDGDAIVSGIGDIHYGESKADG